MVISDSASQAVTKGNNSSSSITLTAAQKRTGSDSSEEEREGEHSCVIFSSTHDIPSQVQDGSE